MLQRHTLETELIVLLKQGSRKGHEILYENYSGALFGSILRIVKNHELAEEILSESFLRIIRSFNQYEPSKSRLFTWMINIARNLSIDKVRSKEYKNALKTDGLEMLAEGPTFSVSPLEGKNLDVKSALQYLDQPYKNLIDMAYLQGYTHEEISKELRIPLGTVKTRIRKAISNLRNVFND